MSVSAGRMNYDDYKGFQWAVEGASYGWASQEGIIGMYAHTKYQTTGKKDYFFSNFTDKHTQK